LEVPRKQEEDSFWATTRGDMIDSCGRGFRNGQTVWERRRIRKFDLE
jgi:hypothetical protein